MTKHWKIGLLLVVAALVWGQLLWRLLPSGGRGESHREITSRSDSAAAATGTSRREFIESPDARVRDPFQSLLFYPSPKLPPPPAPPKPVQRPPRVQYVGVVQGLHAMKAFLRGEKPGLREVARDSLVEGLRLRVIRKDSVQVKWQDSTWWIRRESLR